MKVVLEVIKGLEVGRTFEFTTPETFIVGRGGQDRPVHLKLLHDPYVSRQHFMLEVSPPCIFFKDLGSTNTPCVNGLFKVEEELHDGDVIEVGYTQLKVHIHDEVEMRTVHCRKCGESISITADETPPEYCSRCQREVEESARKARRQKPRTIVCQKCGKDLTRRANSDGRAQELHGIVKYYCEKCVKSMKEGEDAGRKFDGYEVIRNLGEGGMGKVYQVYHKPTARVAAMKQVLKLSVKQLIQRFERETRYMKELVHTNTIRFIDSGVYKDRPYLVIELASHGNLDDRIDPTKGFLSPQEAVLYIADALDGLEFIHQKKIVHRDLKPENILLQENGDGGLMAKIADFGLAKKYTEAGGSLMTRLGKGIGTILYMSPEQIRDTASVREPADIYSMGVTLYYLLTGKYPYNFPTSRDIQRFLNERRQDIRNAEEALAQLMRIQRIKSPELIVLTEEPIPIRERKSDIPVALANVVDKAIRKDISSRYQTAAEFRQELQEAL